mmetsp:Transcript_33079/g.54117  ORF Transcript_33079/g.54117 Transcript_33079/m.54117 type:complete len:310 (+) Transcript_33079:996-1925(+)
MLNWVPTDRALERTLTLVKAISPVLWMVSAPVVEAGWVPISMISAALAISTSDPSTPDPVMVVVEVCSSCRVCDAVIWLPSTTTAVATAAWSKWISEFTFPRSVPEPETLSMKTLVPWITTADVAVVMSSPAPMDVISAKKYAVALSPTLMIPELLTWTCKRSIVPAPIVRSPEDLREDRASPEMVMLSAVVRAPSFCIVLPTRCMELMKAVAEDGPRRMLTRSRVMVPPVVAAPIVFVPCSVMTPAPVPVSVSTKIRASPATITSDSTTKLVPICVSVKVLTFPTGTPSIRRAVGVGVSVLGAQFWTK